MSTTEMLTIKTSFDPSGLQEMEKKTEVTLGGLKRSFASAAKDAQITPTINNAELKKQVADVEKELNKLNKQRAELVITVPKSAERDKEFARISKQIQDLVKDKKTIEVEVDTKTAESSLDRMYQKIATGKIEIPIDQKKLKERIKELDTDLKALVKRRDILISMPKNPQRDQALEKLDKKIKELTGEKKIKVELDQKKLAEANTGLGKLVKSFGLVAAAVAAANAVFVGFGVAIAGQLDHIDKASQKLGLSAQTYQELSYFASQTGTDVDRLARSMRTLSIQAVAGNSSYKALGISVKNASGEFKTQEELFTEVLGALSKIPEGVQRAKVANDLLGMSSQELAAAMNAGAEGYQKAAEEARKFGIIVDDSVVKAGADATSAFGTMFSAIKALLQNAIAPILPELTKMAYSIAEFAAGLRESAEKYVPMFVNGLKALLPVVGGIVAGLTTYVAVWGAVVLVKKAATVATTAFALATRGLTAAMAANPIGLLAVAVAALVTGLIYAIKNWEMFSAKVKYYTAEVRNFIFTIFENIRIKVAQFQTTVQNALMDLLKFIVDKFLSKLSALVGSLSGLPFIGDMFKSAQESLESLNKSIVGGLEETQKKNTAYMIALEANTKTQQAARVEYLKNQKEAIDQLKKNADEEVAIEEQKQQELNNIDLGDKGKTGKAEKDKIKALEERYAAQVLIAHATIKNEEELTEELKRIDTAYYTEKLKLMQEALEAQIIKGKELTQAQIAEYTDLQEKLKEITKEQTQLGALEETYKARMEIARRTVDDEEKLEAELSDLKLKYLQERLDILLKEAETTIKVRGSISDAEIAEINRVKAEIEQLEDAKTFGAKLKALAEQFADYLSNMVSSFTDFMSSMYDKRIDSLDKKHEQELRMIENRLAAETAMLEAQLEQYADLDERKEALAEEHEERMRDLTERQWEHLTEEEWRALEDQRQTEEARYAESLAALEADMAARDELQLQQEIAEAEALARKEALEKEYAIRRAQMERKQAIADKANALFSAGVNMARAIARAFAEHMFPKSAVIAGIVGTMGAAQMAAIAARPLPAIPSYFKGGEVTENNKRQYSHMPQPDNPHDNSLAWVRTGEWVLPLHEASAYKKIQAMGLTLADLLMPQPQFALPDGGSVSSVSGSHNTTITQNNKYEVKEALTYRERRRFAEKQALAIARKFV